MNYYEAKQFIEQVEALCGPFKEEVDRDVFLAQRAYAAGQARQAQEETHE